MIREFIAALEEKISSSTVRSRLSLLSAICQDLVAQDYLQRNPFLDVPYTARSRQERRAFTDQEITLLKDHQHPCYWPLMTGIRTGEHVHFQIEDLASSLFHKRKTDRLSGDLRLSQLTAVYPFQMGLLNPPTRNNASDRPSES